MHIYIPMAKDKNQKQFPEYTLTVLQLRIEDFRGI